MHVGSVALHITASYDHTEHLKQENKQSLCTYAEILLYQRSHLSTSEDLQKNGQMT